MKRFRKLTIFALSALTCLLFGLSAAACGPKNNEGDSLEYNVEVYLQNISGTSYTLNTEYSVPGKGGEGDVIEAPQIEHFTENTQNENATPANERVLNQMGQTFKFYYDRDAYAISYVANEPSGSGRATGRAEEQNVAYGGSFRLAENPFTLQGYRFAGWSTAANDEVEYAPNDRVQSVSGPLTYYAVWDRGYTDRAGSADVIFFPRSSETLAILLRGSREFEGTRTGNTFTFDRPAGALTGTVFGNTFSYAREDIAGTYYLYDCMDHPDFFGGAPFDSETRTNRHISLQVDQYMNATYTENGVETEGSVSYTVMGDYEFKGENNKSFHFNFLDEEEKEHFSICGGEASAYVEAMQIAGSFYLTGGSLVLDGYGRAVLYMATGGFNLGYDGFYTVTGSITQRGQTMYRISAVIEDLIGGLGGAEGEVYENILYTIPSLVSNEMGVADGYVSADVYFGTYVGEGGATLTLDGIGLFEDSAVYKKADGTVVKGTYSSTADRKTGLVVSITDSAGRTLATLKGDAYANPRTFTEYQAPKPEDEYIELYRATSQLDYPMIYLYPNAAVTGGHKAEIWVSDDEGTTLVLGATGRYTTETKHGKEFYTFTRTTLENGVSENDVPSSLVFFLSSVFSSEDNNARYVYCVREWNGVKQYTTYTGDGVTVEASNEVTLMSVGSLLLKGEGADAVYIEGSTEYSRSTNFNKETLVFIYPGENGAAAEYRYTVTGTTLTPAVGSELPLYYYLFIEETQSGRYVQDLVLDGSVDGDDPDAVGQALFNDDYGDGDWQNGTYKLVGSTKHGYNVYELTVGGTVRFRFALYGIGNDTVYFRYNETLDKKFTAEGGNELDLDGYYYGIYWVGGSPAYLGAFSYNPVQQLIYFTADTGEEFYFRIEGDTCIPLDNAFGNFQLIDGNYESINNANIYFDGRGNVTVTFADGTQRRTGTYRAYLPDSDEYIVNCNFGTGMNTPSGGWHVRLLFGVYAQGCIVFDEAMSGTFANDNWDVLYLDGFGTGSLYAADGSFGGEGDYTVLDGDKGLMTFTFDTNNDVSIIFDRANQTFELLDFSDISYLYLSNDLDYIAFTSNGVLRIGRNEGMYFYTETTYYGFLYDYDTEGYLSVELPVPGGKTYTYGGKTYSLWGGSSKLSLNGVVEFYDKTGKLTANDGTAATLEVSLLTGANYNMAAKITIDGETDENGQPKVYDFVLNLYTGGVHDPRLTYDGIDYKVKFTLNETQKFAVHAGWYEVEMEDYYAGYRDDEGGHHGAKIVKEVIGFGPIVHGDPTYSGRILYHDTTGKNPLTFSVSRADMLKVGYRVGGLGDCLEIRFEQGGKQYAIDFYETVEEVKGPVFVLQGFFGYEEKTTEGYKVGVKTLIAATTPNSAGNNGDGVTDPNAVGKPYSVTLWKGDAADPIVCYDTGISLNRDAVWLCQLDHVVMTDDGSEVPAAGKGYYIEFSKEGDAVTGVTVGEYTIGQALTGPYLVNYFIGDGKVEQVVGVAYSDGTSYYWIENTHDLTYHKDTDTWTFRGTPGANATETEYTITFRSSGEEGKIAVSVTQG